MKVQVKTFYDSPDDDDPTCICSLCGNPFKPMILDSDDAPFDWHGPENPPGSCGNCGAAIGTDAKGRKFHEGYCSVETEETREDDFPIRLFDDKGKWEARFHLQCFDQLFEIKDNQFHPRSEIEIAWIPPTWSVGRP